MGLDLKETYLESDSSANAQIDFSSLSRGLKVPAELIRDRIMESVVFTSFFIVGWIMAINNSSFVAVNLLVVPAWFLFTVSMYILNDITDIESDSENQLDRPLVRGSVGKKEASVVAFAFVISGVAILASISLISLLISVIYLSVGIAYTVPPLDLKKRWWGKPSTLGAAALLSLIAGGTVQSFPGVVILPFAVALPIFIALIAPIGDLRDVQGDQVAGRKNIVINLGSRRTIDVTIMGFLLLISSIMFAYVYFGFNLAIVAFGVGVSVFNVLYLARNRSAFSKGKFIKMRKMCGLSVPLVQLGIILGIL